MSAVAKSLESHLWTMDRHSCSNPRNDLNFPALSSWGNFVELTASRLFVNRVKFRSGGRVEHFLLTIRVSWSVMALPNSLPLLPLSCTAMVSWWPDDFFIFKQDLHLSLTFTTIFTVLNPNYEIVATERSSAIYSSSVLHMNSISP